MKKSLLFLFLLAACISSYAQPLVQWRKQYSEQDMVQTKDGGYALIGLTGSPSQVHVEKTDSLGGLMWEKNYGTYVSDYGIAIIELNAGGYIVTGHTEGSGYADHRGGYDIWIAKLKADGTTIWSKCYGGSKSDYPANILATADGGYIFTGSTNSKDSDVSKNYGGTDLWVVKINDTGGIHWQYSYGGSAWDGGSFIEPTVDGGYIISGGSWSNDGTLNSHYGATDDGDAWLIKINQSGRVQWQKNYGGTNHDYFTCVRQVKGGGYIALGTTKSNDNNVQRDDTTQVVWVVRTDQSGNVTWSKTFIPSEDIGWTIVQAVDSSFVVSAAPYELPYPHKLWLTSLDSKGDMTWETTLNDSFYGGPRRLIQTKDEGFAVVSGAYLLKLGSYSKPTGMHHMVAEAIKVYPNPTNGKIYIDLPKEYEHATIKVMNMMCIQFQVTPPSYKTMAGKREPERREINLEGMPAGMYLLHVYTTSGVMSYKVMYRNP